MAIKKQEVVTAAVADMQTQIQDVMMMNQLETTKSQVGNITVHNTSLDVLEGLMAKEFNVTFERKNPQASDAWVGQAHLILSAQGRHSLIQVMSY